MKHKIIKSSLVAALVMSSCIAAVPATAAPSSVGASTTKKATQPSWAASGDFASKTGALTLAHGGSKTLKHSALNPPQGVNPMLQHRVNGKWVNLTRVPVVRNVVSVTVGGSKPTHKSLVFTPGESKMIRLVWLKGGVVTSDRATSMKTITGGKVNASSSAKYPYGKAATVNATPGKTFSTTVDSHTKTLRVQRYNTQTKKWITSLNATRGKTSKGKTAFSYKMPTQPAGSTQKMRFYVPAQKQVKEWAGEVQQVRYAKTKTTIGAAAFEKLSVISVTGGQKAPAYVTGPSGRTVQVQQYVNKKWVTKTTTKTPKGSATVTLPKLKHGSKATFRIYAPATSSHLAVASKSVTVTYQDPRKVTGLAKEVRDQMKSKCPHATVTLTSKEKFRGWAASASGSENRILVYSKLNRKRSDWKSFLKYIAQHECAHILTHQAAAKAKVSSPSVSMNKLFGTKGGSGAEHMADAISTAWSGSTKNNYYKKKFTKKQLDSAKRVLAGKWF